MSITDRPEKTQRLRRWKRILILVAAVLVTGTVLFFVVRQFESPKHRTGDKLSWNMQLDEPINPAQNGFICYGSNDEGTASFIYYAVVEAELTRILPDVYTQPTEILGGDLWHIVQMKTQDVVAGENIPGEFYLMLPADYSTELTKYDRFLVALSQKSIADYTMINTGMLRYESFYPLFGIGYDNRRFPDRVYDTVFNSGGAFGVLAFTDGYLDTSLWAENMWDASGWETVLASDSDYPVKAGYSLAEAKQAILEFRKTNSQYIKPEYGKFFTPDDYPTEEAAALIDTVTSFRNGAFSYTGGSRGPGFYHRLVNGLPTNEYYTLNEDGTVAEPNVVFTDADITKCPDLSAAIKSTTGEKPDWYQETWITEVRAGYHKDGDNIFGYICVVWADKHTTVETKSLIVHPDGTLEDLNTYQWEQRLGR